MKRLIVVSDLHLAGGPLASPVNGAALGRFLASLDARETTVVMAGDVFDFLHVMERPAHLDLPNAPHLLRRALDVIATEPWWGELRDGWARFLNSGGECFLMPGNHDPELHHPGCRDVLLGALGIESSRRLAICSSSVMKDAMESQAIRIEHGNTGDIMNDVNPEAVREALSTGDRRLHPPPGSRLVMEVVNSLKLSIDPDTGKQRFPFLDLLKPEAGVVLLLLYLEPRLALAKLNSMFGVGWQAIGRKLMAIVRGGIVLGAEGLAHEDDLPNLIAAAIADGLPTEWASEPTTVEEHWRQFATDPELSPASRHVLANHGGLRPYILRAALKSLSQDRSFFKLDHLEPGDQSSISRLSRDTKGPRILIRGHSHAARAHRDGDFIYFNSGTWMNLMEIDAFETDEQLQTWIDRIEKGVIPSRSRLTYVEITASRAGLYQWPVRATKPEEAEELDGFDIG